MGVFCQVRLNWSHAHICLLQNILFSVYNQITVQIPFLIIVPSVLACPWNDDQSFGGRPGVTSCLTWTGQASSQTLAPQLGCPLRKWNGQVIWLWLELLRSRDWLGLQAINLVLLVWISMHYLFWPVFYSQSLYYARGHWDWNKRACNKSNGAENSCSPVLPSHLAAICNQEANWHSRWPIQDLGVGSSHRGVYLPDYTIAPTPVVSLFLSLVSTQLSEHILHVQKSWTQMVC